MTVAPRLHSHCHAGPGARPRRLRRVRRPARGCLDPAVRDGVGSGHDDPTPGHGYQNYNGGSPDQGPYRGGCGAVDYQRYLAAPISAAPIRLGYDSCPRCELVTAQWANGRLVMLVEARPRMRVAAYDPAAGRWQTLRGTTERYESLGLDSAWTGRQMLALGSIGVRIDPARGVVGRFRRPAGRHDGLRRAGAFVTWGGGCCEETSNEGAAFNPVTGRWRPLSASPLAPREAPLGVWTGRRLIIAGGLGFFTDAQGVQRSTVLRTAGAWNPATNTWRLIAPMPGGREGTPALWTGRQVLMFGTQARILIYTPATNRWRISPRPAGLPSVGRRGPAATRSS